MSVLPNILFPASKRPAHARKFAGGARCIPERDTLLLPYQSKYVLDRSLYVLVEKARRVGLTWGTEYALAREHAVAGVPIDSWVSSRDEITAMEFVRGSVKWCEILQIGAEDQGQQVINAEKGHTAHVLRFANGSQVYSLSSNPDAFAGRGGNVVLDEFGVRENPRRTYGIAKHTIDWGGRMRIISTHRGSQNFFNKLIEEVKHKGNPKGFSLHSISLECALKDGFLWKLQTKLSPEDPRFQMDEADYWNYQRSTSPDEETFLEECCLHPTDDASAFIPTDHITACTYPAGVRWEYTVEDLLRCKNPLYVGVDIARRRDLTCIWVFEEVSGRLFTRMVITLKNVKFSQQEAVLYPILACPAVQRACIDATGIGMQFAERAQEMYGQYRVEAVTFTAPVKEAIAYPLKAALEDRTVVLPDMPTVAAAFRAVRKISTIAGNIRLDADATEKGHADEFWAAGLAKMAATQPPGKLEGYLV